MLSEDRLILYLVHGNFSSRVQEQARALMGKSLNEQRACSGEQGATSLDWDSILERVVTEEVYPLFYRNLNAIGREAKEQRAKGKDQSAASIEQGAMGPSIALTRNVINASNAERQAQPMALELQAPCYTKAEGMEEALERLSGLVKINAFRNTLLTEELVRVLKLFAEAGIPTIPLKGPALAQTLYGDPGLRTCVDVDILVPRSMVGRAFNLLRADGYTSEFGSGFFADLLLRHDIEYALRRQERGFDYMVELHWGVLWGGKLENSVTDRLWADAYPTTVFDAPAYSLSAEWQILFLAAHAARHQWQGLKWLVDLHELYSSPDVDWEKLDKKAKQLGWEELLRVSFLACHSLFDTPIPAKYLIGDLPSWVKLFPDSAAANLSGAFFAARFLTRTSDKLCYVARVLLVPTLAEWRLVQLPPFVSYLYYPLRPLRLMWKWSLAFLAASLEREARI